MTGFSPAMRNTIIERALGRCERCGDSQPVHVHHRRPRGMGGCSRPGATNLPANGVHVCLACHEWIEHHRTAAKASGWLVEPWDLPAEVPLTYWDGERVYLDDDGSVNPIAWK